MNSILTLIVLLWLAFVTIAANSFYSFVGSPLRRIAKHVFKNLPVSANGEKLDARLMNEFRTFSANPPMFCSLLRTSTPKIWTVIIDGPTDSIYAGEKFRLKLTFPPNYPSSPPVVYFLQPVPRHVHVYSNGDICLDVLGKSWRPNMSAESIVVSIVSMMSSAREKRTPIDNSRHMACAPGNQDDGWTYHDDNC